MALSKGAVTIITTAITAAATLGASWITASKGLVSFPNPALQSEVDALRQKLESRSQLTGDFEWQWAGDNWLGSVKFQNLANSSITARTEVRVLKADPQTQFRTFKDSPGFQSVVDGTVNVSQQAIISLHMPVSVSPEYLKAHHTRNSNVMLDAELQPVDAFAGRVRIVGDQTTTGDMILVRYRSDVRKW